MDRIEQKWHEAGQRMEALDMQVKSLNLMASIGTKSIEFVQNKDINIPQGYWNVYQKMEARREAITRLNASLKRIKEGVESEALGLRYKNGDVDVLAPPEMNEDEKVYYSFKGLGFVHLFQGTLIVQAINSVIATLYSESKTIRGKYVALKNEADKRLCKDPNSEMCIEWKDVKEREKFDEVQETSDSFWDKAERTWNSVKSVIGKGATIGIAVLIPLVALMIWSKIK